MGVVLFLLGYTELVQLLLYSGFNPRQRDDLNQVNLIGLHFDMFIFFYLFQIPFVSDDLAWKVERVLFSCVLSKDSFWKQSKRQTKPKTRLGDNIKDICGLMRVQVERKAQYRIAWERKAFERFTASQSQTYRSWWKSKDFILASITIPGRNKLDR